MALMQFVWMQLTDLMNDFNLIVLMVLEYFQEGIYIYIPMGLSTHEDQIVLVCTLQSLKKSRKINPKWFMSDMTPQCHND